MKKDFQDHFGSIAADYAQSRPSYPPGLYEWLASQCRSQDVAWDCGTGSGQVATRLAGHFRHVIATDASAGQIAQAVQHPRVEYRVALAENSGLDDCCADLVVVAQALHWFDLDRFYAEVRRVLKPKGFIAAWSYGVLSIDDAAIDALVQGFCRDTVGPYWPPERHHVETAYCELDFPFVPVPTPAFSMHANWTLEKLLGYFRSWSATARFIEDKGFDPVSRLASSLQVLWGDPHQERAVDWPLALLLGRTNR